VTIVFKSVLCVLAGYGVMMVVTMVLFGVLGAVSPESFGGDPEQAPGISVLLLILVVGLFAALGGGWVTARLAPGNPVRHVLALVVLLIAMSAVSVLVPSEQAAPAWYQAGLAVVGVCGALLGGRLRVAGPGTA
jgi:hypothetical protein